MARNEVENPIVKEPPSRMTPDLEDVLAEYHRPRFDTAKYEKMHKEALKREREST